jgi:hypothetical protein
MAKIAHVFRAIATVAVMATCGATSAASAPRGSAVSDPAQALYASLFHASVRASRAARRIVSFDTTDASPAVDRLYPLAAERASDAIVALAGQPDGRRMLAAVDAVRFRQGASRDVVLDGRTLMITVNPVMGASGCPSIQDIERTLWRSRSEADPERWPAASLSENYSYDMPL